MIKPEETYTAFEISLAGFIYKCKTTATVVSWLKKYHAKYPDRVTIRQYPPYQRKNGKVVKENPRYLITGENLISLIAHIEDGSI